MLDHDRSASGAATLRDVLRAAGQAPHQRVDDAVGGALHDADGYAALLTLLAAFHAAADPLLARWTAGSTVAPGEPMPSRAALYADDLRVLGRPVPAPMSLDGLPRTDADVLTEPAGIALLYVVAGSTVGARHLLRMVPADVPALARRGLADASSTQAAQLWRATRDVLAAPAESAVARPAADACGWLFGRLLGSVEAALAA